MNSTGVKRSRASAEQLSQMVDFMVNNPGLAGGKFKRLHGKLECDKKWSELAEALNCLGGAVKTVNQWQAVWKELKSRTSVKVRDRKRQQALTGNKPLTQEALSEMERRVVAIIGNDYIEGHESVAENIPMEEDLQILLEDGEEVVLLSPSNTNDTFDLRCNTPSTSKGSPRRGLKRKRAEEESQTKKQFLEIANKQADALKMLAECSASNEATNKMISDALKSMGEGLKETAIAITNLGNVISKICDTHEMNIPENESDRQLNDCIVDTMVSFDDSQYCKQEPTDVFNGDVKEESNELSACNKIISEETVDILMETEHATKDMLPQNNKHESEDELVEILTVCKESIAIENENPKTEVSTDIAPEDNEVLQSDENIEFDARCSKSSKEVQTSDDMSTFQTAADYESDRHFALSLTNYFQRLNLRKKAKAKIDILNYFHKLEFNEDAVV